MSDIVLYPFDDMRAAFERGTIETDHGLEWRTVNTSKGYGFCSWTTDGFGIQVGAHRVAWMLENGPIPTGFDIDHQQECPKTCVTAAHLQALSKSDHLKLGWERGELNGGWGTKRTRIHPPKELFVWKVEIGCPNCGVVFLPNTAWQIYCDDDCKERAATSRRFPRPDIMICAWESCSTEFKPKRKDSNFCSRKCIEDDQNNKKKLRKLQLKSDQEHE